MHLANYDKFVWLNKEVSGGDQIGIMGNSGEGKTSMGIHLHLAVFTGDKYSRSPLGYAPNGISYKGTDGITRKFYDPQKLFEMGVAIFA